MDRFFNNLPVFTEFQEPLNEGGYRTVPNDWLIIIADIRGSTAAIENGRYRDVNFIGAAAITSMLVHVSPDIPYCFGGDGATLLINKELLEESEKVLKSLCYWSQACFNLELHAGCIPVDKINLLGAKVQIAKHQLHDNVYLSMFRGGGVTLAEKLIKEGAQYRIQPSPIMSQGEVFSRLTCRWQPIPASKGITLSILIDSLGKDNDIFAAIMDELEAILGGSIHLSNPVSMKNARYHSFVSNISRQLKVSGCKFNKKLFQEFTELFVTLIAFNLKLFRFIPSLNHYIEKLPKHCDFQKCDDTLRMVLNCSQQEYQKIVDCLEYHSKHSNILYGVHCSDAAQMTCYVAGVNDGEHLHFIDGHGGGYALAAKMLKDKMQYSVA